MKLIDRNQGEETIGKMDIALNPLKEYQTSCEMPVDPASPAPPKRHLQIISLVAFRTTENNMPDQIA